MNTYYEVLKHLKELFENDEKVKTVVTGDFEEWRADLFPLVHIDITDSPYASESNNAVVQFNVVLTVLDIRDVNKEDVKDRFWHNDTRHDSWNDTLSILKIALNRTIRDHYEVDIDLVTATTMERLTYAMGNGLDGWQQTWTINVPDSFTSNCYGD